MKGAGGKERSAARRELLRFFRASKRDLPWRRTSDPYRIWVSEVMLQQTTVAAAAPYYERFVARFPTAASLAAAAEDEVLAVWSGLGYYHRARNLLRGARHVLARHGGAFPRDRSAALAVPGVGLYTANAVLSIAYGEPLAVVDGNVKRVLARVFALRGAAATSDATYHNLAADLLDAEAPGDWNQAIMELGATVCTPRAPACGACPWRARCQALALGLQDTLPLTAKRKAPVEVTVQAALVRRGDKFLFARRPEGALMGRMWELPQTRLDRADGARGRPDLAAEALERYGLELAVGSLRTTVRHAITFRRIRLEGYEATLLRPVRASKDLRFLDLAELGSVPTSSLSRKLLRGALAPQLPLPLGVL